jgi:hypothetical protein
VVDVVLVGRAGMKEIIDVCDAIQARLWTSRGGWRDSRGKIIQNSFLTF